MKIFNMLRGISGEFEVNRVVGALGATAYIVCANGFVAWMLVKGHEFDLIAYCTAFPGGLAIAVGAIAGAVAIKDRNVATAQVVRDTGGQPTSAAAPEADPNAEPAPVKVMNKPTEAVPTTTGGETQA